MSKSIFFVSSTITKKISRLPMCNIQTEYKKIVITKNKVNLFVSHKNEILIFWHNILNNR